MNAFKDAYLSMHADVPLRILDVGAAAAAVGAETYRPLFDKSRWHYLGMDVCAGDNVDIVVADPYDWREIDDASFDVVISGQAFEHIEWPWLSMMEIARVVRPCGIVAVTAPSGGHVHRYPKDCWRYYPDGFPALAAFAGLEVLESEVDFGYAYPSCAFWGDAFAILQRPLRTAEDERAWHRRMSAAKISAGREVQLEREDVPQLVQAPFGGVGGRATIAARNVELLARRDKISTRAGIARVHAGRALRALMRPLSRLRRS
jgi:SAM-dependent methyltransferase